MFSSRATSVHSINLKNFFSKYKIIISICIMKNILRMCIEHKTIFIKQRIVFRHVKMFFYSEQKRLEKIFWFMFKFVRNSNFSQVLNNQIGFKCCPRKINKNSIITKWTKKSCKWLSRAFHLQGPWSLIMLNYLQKNKNKLCHFKSQALLICIVKLMKQLCIIICLHITLSMF